MDIDYNTVKTKISQIRSKIRELEEQYKDINNLLNETIKIDNKIPKEEELTNLSTHNTEIINEINNIILPSINNKQ